MMKKIFLFVWFNHEPLQHRLQNICHIMRQLLQRRERYRKFLNIFLLNIWKSRTNPESHNVCLLGFQEITDVFVIHDGTCGPQRIAMSSTPEGFFIELDIPAGITALAYRNYTSWDVVFWVVSKKMKKYLWNQKKALPLHPLWENNSLKQVDWN